MVMADRALRLSLPRPSDFIFHNFSNPFPWRFQNPSLAPPPSRIIHCSSSTIVLLVPASFSPSARRGFSDGSGGAAGEDDGGGGYGRAERRNWRRRRKRRWRLEELLEDGLDDDDGGGGGDDDPWRFVGEVIDNVWIFKVLKSYGYLLPFIVISFLSATGPKAFLTALGVAAGPSLLFLAFQKLTARDKRRTKSRTSNLGLMEEEEEEEEEKRKNTRVGYYSSRFGSNGTPSEMGRTGNSSSAGVTSSSRFGGWDDLDSNGSIPKPSHGKNEPMRKPVGNRKRTGYKRVRREEPEPLLLRLLVSMFPFLSS
ncbi:PREDICTED: uncharacterized protein LOC104826102 [Tarenaya hassleriana]|uniref:uncharacterized protein LOC104826102 n=1 Tax=Tarenaya hassleriana TaxID=28532 RepID=UPI00053C1C94|nr:PREDICTED: uncharacterized protein LOC104826102 [Tarenaya hassleriana]